MPVFSVFKKTFPRPEDLAAATESTILRVIGSLGLRWRAKFLKLLGQELAKTGRVPGDVNKLIRLPGVGPYAASAYVSFHRGKRGVLLDSNIVRFYGRLLGLQTGPESRRTRVFKDIARGRLLLLAIPAPITTLFLTSRGPSAHRDLPVPNARS